MGEISESPPARTWNTARYRRPMKMTTDAASHSAGPGKKLRPRRNPFVVNPLASLLVSLCWQRCLCEFGSVADILAALPFFP